MQTQTYETEPKPPRKNACSRTLTALRLPNHLLAAVDSRATELGVTRTSVIEAAVQLFLEKEGLLPRVP